MHHDYSVMGNNIRTDPRPLNPDVGLNNREALHDPRIEDTWDSACCCGVDDHDGRMLAKWRLARRHGVEAQQLDAELAQPKRIWNYSKISGWATIGQ